MKKNKNKKVCIQTSEVLSIELLAERISQTIDNEDVPLFITILERMYEDWELTEKLIRHFKALEIIYNKIKLFIDI